MISPRVATPAATSVDRSSPAASCGVAERRPAPTVGAWDEARLVVPSPLLDGHLGMDLLRIS